MPIYVTVFLPPHVREEIRRCAGTQFDPKIIEVFPVLWVHLCPESTMFISNRTIED
jgi:hypothetical protein